jgi:hypothetical protein
MKNKGVKKLALNKTTLKSPVLSRQELAKAAGGLDMYGAWRYWYMGAGSVYCTDAGHYTCGPA